jgi:hypothetical protein
MVIRQQGRGLLVDIESVDVCFPRQKTKAMVKSIRRFSRRARGQFHGTRTLRFSDSERFAAQGFSNPLASRARIHRHVLNPGSNSCRYAKNANVNIPIM